MPELPDVENFKNYFRATSLNKEIFDIEAESEGLIKNITFSEFRNSLVGRKFSDVHRRGKFLIVDVDGIDEKLIFHFGMTGGLEYKKQDEKRSKFARVIFKFKNGHELMWLNQRKFGKIYLVKNLEQVGLLKNMGPEPLEISEKEFLQILERNKTKNIKALLMDQAIIAGIGNIFSDEIMFRARVLPSRKVSQLSTAEKSKLYREMKLVLQKAVATGKLARELPLSWLIPHRHTDMICPRCGGPLKKETIAGRSAYFCPRCQR